MAFNGQEGSPIDSGVAGTWTAAYRTESPDSTLGHFFGRDILLQILGQSNNMGIRFYYGLDDSGNKQLLAVGADNEQNDQLTKGMIVGDDSCACPPWSSVANVLNS
jgi:hypothetical protein